MIVFLTFHYDFILVNFVLRYRGIYKALFFIWVRTSAGHCPNGDCNDQTIWNERIFEITKKSRTYNSQRVTPQFPGEILSAFHFKPIRSPISVIVRLCNIDIDCKSANVYECGTVGFEGHLSAVKWQGR